MSKANILVVEDDKIIAMEIKDRLESFGYEVPAVVFSGEQAIAKATELKPSLVLMDIHLKGNMDGIEVAENIHSLLDIPVIYLTAYADENTLQRAKITEPYGYILKPLEERELHSTIEITLYKHQIERKLKESEENYRAIVETFDGYIYVNSPDNTVKFVNKKMMDFVGRNVIGELCYKAIYSRDSVCPWCVNEKVFEGQTVRFERQNERDKRWFYEVSTPIHHPDGFLYKQSMIEDITDRKSSEQKLVWDESLLRQMTNSSQLGFYAVDEKNGNILYYNHKFCELWNLGHVVEDKIQKFAIKNSELHEYMLQRVKNLTLFNSSFEQFKNLNHRIRFEDEISLIDGRTIKRFTTQLRDVEDHYLGRLFIFEDITERKLYESLLQSEEEYRLLIEHASDAIAILDSEGSILLINSKFCQMLGFSREELLAMNFKSVIDPEDITLRPFNSSGFYEGKSTISERRLRSKNGTIIHVEINAKMISNNRIHSIIRDVTARKKQETELKKAILDEIYEKLFTKLHAFRHGENSSMNLNRLSLYVKNLEAIIESDKDTFSDDREAKIASGDAILKQPAFERLINTLSEFKEIVAPQIKQVAHLLGVVESEFETLIIHREYYVSSNEIIVASENLIRAFDDIIKMIKENTYGGDFGLKLKEITESIRIIKNSIRATSKLLETNFSSSIADISKSLIQKYQKSTPNVKFELVYSNDDHKAIINPIDYQEILAIIIENAIDSFSKKTDNKNKYVRMNISRVDNLVKVVVENNGERIDPSFHKLIFTENFTTKGEGRGFGLSFAKKSIEKYGGKIYLDSKYNEGARFVIELLVN